MYLVEPALASGERVLKPGGATLIKVFQGAGFQELVAAARRKFAKVKLCKPEASRPRNLQVVFAGEGVPVGVGSISRVLKSAKRHFL